MQRRAHRGLRHEHLFGRSRYVFSLSKVERDQQVEIESMELHGATMSMEAQMLADRAGGQSGVALWVERVFPRVEREIEAGCLMAR